MAARAPLRAAAAGAIIAILAVVVLAADQLAKHFAIENLPPEQPVHVIGDVLIFYLVRNPGAAFSMGESVTWLFTIALAVVAAVIIALIARVRSRAWAIVLGLLLGGVLGNLSDRLFRSPGFAVGHVVDFISTPWMMPAIYNVADMFIVCSMIAVALLVLLGVRLDGTRDRHRHGETTADPESEIADDAAVAEGDTEDDAAAAEDDAAAADGAQAPIGDPGTAASGDSPSR